MVSPSAGVVVSVPFPFSDLSQSKLRPAVALAGVGRGDWILFQFTSNLYGDNLATTSDNVSFSTGSLHLTSYARPGKLFTTKRDLIVREVGTLKDSSLNMIIDGVMNILRSGNTP